MTVEVDEAVEEGEVVEEEMVALVMEVEASVIFLGSP